MNERCPMCGARASVAIDFGLRTIVVEHEAPLCEPFANMAGMSPFTCNVTARTPIGHEHCRKCSRERPVIIADPTCGEGGYCDWTGGPPS